LRVAIVNDGVDTISALSEWFQMNGHVPIAVKLADVRQKTDHKPAEFVQSLRADVVILDIGMPYAVNWYYAELIALSLPGQAIVLTTSNRNALESIVGKSGSFELTGTKDNLVSLLGLVYAAAGRDHDGAVKPVV
jgi:DNA-binding NarL/FixJ family response regulator